MGIINRSVNFINMKIWKDKEGKRIDAKEFISRFKQGVHKITPLQNAKVTLYGYWIIFAGMLFGAVVAFQLKTWWLLTILCGSFIISLMSFIGIWQRYDVLKNIDKMIKEVSNETEI
jgi:hypothetical protein